MSGPSGIVLRHTRSEIVRRFLAAWQAEDRPAFEALMAHDFIFTSPYDDALDKAGFFDRCWPNNGYIREHVFEQVIEEGEEAIVRYKAVTRDGKEFRNVEWLVFAGERVRSVNVYFGASYMDGAFVRQGC